MEEKKEAAAVVSSGPGDENKEQGARRPQTAADRGKEKVHDS